MERCNLNGVMDTFRKFACVYMCVCVVIIIVSVFYFFNISIKMV